MTLQTLCERLVVYEKDAEDLYGHIAEKSSGKVAALAAKLSIQEKSHGARIEKIFADEDLEAEVHPPLRMLFESQEAEPLGKQPLEEITSEKKLFTLAMQIEKESIVLYGEIADQLPEDRPASQLFRQLVSEEKGHLYTVLKILQDLL